MASKEKKTYCLDGLVCEADFPDPGLSQGHVCILAKLLGVGRKQAGRLPRVREQKSFLCHRAQEPCGAQPCFPRPQRPLSQEGSLSHCPPPTHFLPLSSDSEPFSFPGARESPLSFCSLPAPQVLGAKLRAGTILLSFCPLPYLGVTDLWVWAKLMEHFQPSFDLTVGGNSRQVPAGVNIQ